ncbi:MarR family winged helix-turn-helix transcriptional regulator [Streptosporangium sp. NPDC023615]|uniref:MarR family winged helix-turn-helix transcriptional regulator n=1 Tax=Streptosporangium sp. NPDC023615 TaxID=3154794 RepID=UPI0034334F7D
MRNPHDRRVRPGGPAPGQAGPALFALVRHWSRRWPQQAAGDGAESGHVSRVVIVDVIGGSGATGATGDLGDVGDAGGTGGDAGARGADGTGAGRADRAARVGVRDVAEALGVDRSVASRMVADAVAAGLVRRGTLEGDARHADLVLTASGRELLTAARRWQNERFDSFTADWPAEDREVFARLLVRFVANATAPRG